jgi:hypothetical protein
MGLEQNPALLNQSRIFPVGVILSAYPVSGEATTGGLSLQISYPIQQGRFTISWQSRYSGLTFPISIMASGHCLCHSQKSDRKVPKVGYLPWVYNLGRCWIQVWIQDFGIAISPLEGEFCNGSISMKAAKLEIGVLRQEAEGKSQKEGARRSIFTNMRCSLCNFREKLIYTMNQQCLNLKF